jgi:two-component system, NarL family, sensor histidine kinase BarA
MSEEQSDFVDTIRGKGELLLSLISSLLDLNKLERGQLRLEAELVDAHAVLTEVQETYLPEAEKRLLHLTVQCADDVPELHADPVRLRQILINLAGNAIKFTPAHGTVRLSAVRSEITLHDADQDDDDGLGAALMMAPEPAVEFRVSDTGIGIAEDELTKIFDAFYQVDGSSTREYGGAGLGLAITKNLVEAHHGKIRVESHPNQGTTFYVTLPQMPPDRD